MDEDWSQAYDNCYWFSETWHQVQDPSRDWPWGFQLHQRKLYTDGRLCVPTSLVPRVLRAHHAAAGHPSGPKLWPQLTNRYQFPPKAQAYKFCQLVSRQCGICQAVKEPNFAVKTKVVSTPVPAKLGESISLDIFNLPAVVHQGKRLDCMVVAVDRLSGWTVAAPARRRGLQAQTVAQEMWERWWQPFGVPATVTSDQGPQFVGAWWRTLCAAMGVREVYSQSHHHSANGRAEMAGKTVQQLLRRLHQEDRINWPQAIPRVPQQLHDLPGPSGRSPYEIVFGGRVRSAGGIPRQPQHESPDARDWLEQGRKIDEKVAAKLTAVHQQRVQKLNESRAAKPVYVPGDRVWLLRPRHIGTDKLLSWWIGPCRVQSRQGADSYVVEDKPEHSRPVHSSQLKPFLEDTYSDNPVPLHYFRQTEEQDAGAEVDEWDVEAIMQHRTEPDGTTWFKTKWVGYDEVTWEPIGNFVHRYNVSWAEYCKKHKIVADVVQHLLGAKALPEADAQ